MNEKWNRLMNPGISNAKPYSPGKSIFEVAREKGVTNIIKMASNENPSGISPKAKAAIEANLSNSYFYPEISSMLVREALSAKFKFPANGIMIGNGADGIIYSLILTLTCEEDEVIIPAITFPMYETVACAMRAKIIFSPLKELAIDLDDILSRITSRTKMIWICNPNNPTGLAIDAKRFSAFLKKVPGDVLVVHDEVYFDFADLSTFPDTLEMLRQGQDNLFILRSFSKAYGLAGIRIGYGIGDIDLVNLMYKVKPPFEISVLAEAAAIAALDDDEFYQKTLTLNQQGKQYLYSQFDEMSVSYYPTQTNFILIDLKQDCMPVYEKLLLKGIIVRPCKSYGLTTFIRLTIGLPENNQRFIKALKEILKGA